MTTATLATPLPPAAEHRRDPIGRRYGRMWARVPRELGYLALTAVIGLVAFTVARALIGVGSGALIVLGVVLLALVLLGSRYLGSLELVRLGWARTAAIPAPAWTPPLRGKRPLRALGDVFANGHYWLFGLHSALLNPLLATLTFTVWFGWLATGLVLGSFPAWGAAVPVGLGDTPVEVAGPERFVVNGRGLADTLAFLLLRQDGAAASAWFVAGLTAIGLLMLALFPFVTRGATLAHWGLARLLLARFPSEDLRSDVARVDAARTAAIVAEDTALRRLERDIHDGPQQRLLRLQMELASAERRLGQDDAAAESIGTARRLATETLDELRALAQGFAPPLLQDRGLSAALGALGRRGAVRVDTAIDVPGEVPDAIERSVYFVAAELVTNAIKHASARRIRLQAGAEAGELRLSVTDDGVGGAGIVPGHGLAGIADRVAGLGGALEVTSPDGGPTTVTARVPLP